MPRLIDYVGRFEFIRQASFAVVRDESVDALSRRRVAQELGTSVNTIRRSVAGWADLARLAADHVVSRRQFMDRWNRRVADPVERAAVIVRTLMPEDLTHLDEELVWLKLVAGCSLHPSGLAEPGELRREFGIGQRGYDDDEVELAASQFVASGAHRPTTSAATPVTGPATGPADPTDPVDPTDPADPAMDPAGDGAAEAATEGGEAVATRGAPDEPTAPESKHEALASYVTERDHVLTAGIGAALDLLEVPEPRADVTATAIAVIEGLTLSACLGRLTPAEATRLAVDHVLGLRPAVAADVAATSPG